MPAKPTPPASRPDTSREAVEEAVNSKSANPSRPAPPETSRDQMQWLCGRRSTFAGYELSCDRERGHKGAHRAYVADHDDVLFWRTNGHR